MNAWYNSKELTKILHDFIVMERELGLRMTFNNAAWKIAYSNPCMTNDEVASMMADGFDTSNSSNRMQGCLNKVVGTRFFDGCLSDWITKNAYNILPSDLIDLDSEEIASAMADGFNTMC